MAAYKCFFCKKYAKCEDRREDCNEYKARPAKVVKRGSTIRVKFR